MKLLKITLALFIFTALYSCTTSHSDSFSELDGTPTNADTVLYNKTESQINNAKDSLGYKQVPKALRR